MAEIKIKLITPRVPNFIMLEGKGGQRQDGFRESPKVSLGDLDDRQLEEIAQEWRADLLKRAKEQRKVR